MMKAADGAQRTARKSVQAKDVAAAAAAAKEEARLHSIRSLLSGRAGKEDAVAFATTARDNAKGGPYGNHPGRAAGRALAKIGHDVHGLPRRVSRHEQIQRHVNARRRRP